VRHSSSRASTPTSTPISALAYLSVFTAICATALALLAMPASASTMHRSTTDTTRTSAVAPQAECKDFVFKAPRRFDPHENFVGCKGTFYMQNDGNLVIYDEFGKPLWASGTISPGAIALFREDGNLVVYSSAGFPLWASHTSAPGGSLVYQANGNLAILDSVGGAVWQSGTGH
jgi:hypothetical protein